VRFQHGSRKIIRRAILAVAVLVTIAACGDGNTGSGAGMHPTITAEQAKQRVVDYAMQAIAVLPPQPAAGKWNDGVDPCDDPTDNGPKGRVIPFVEYKISGLSSALQNHYFDLLRAWWTSHNFRILVDQRPKDFYLWVENNADGFRMTAQANDLGDLYLSSTAPCVWPNGTPAPSTT
jgi:hypothetical protein